MSENNYMELLKKIPKIRAVRKISYHDCSLGCGMIYVKKVSELRFSMYLRKLKKAGYTKISGNETGNNEFCGYISPDGKISVYVYRIGYSGEMRIIAGKAENTPVGLIKEVNNKQNEKICRPFIYQMNAGENIPDLAEGMGYIIRLENGKFIIVDGGYEKAECAREIIAKLRAEAPDPENIVVSCWIITHAHCDHAGGFLAFCRIMKDDSTVKIENIVYNMCISEEQSQFCDNGIAEKMLNHVSQYCPGAKVCIPYAGQKYHIDGAEIKFFYTMQDFMPRVIQNEPDATPKCFKKGDGNVQSLVFSVTVGGKSIMFLADATKSACDEMCARYGRELKSEYVQMSHHGISKDSPRAHNATKEIYGLISPEYAFLPCSNERYKVRMEYDVNRYLESIVKKVYIAALGAETVYLD